MKHGISPTTNRRESRDRGTIVHLSKALVFRSIDPSTADEKGRVKVQYLPLHLLPPEGAMTQIVVAPDKGVTYRRPNPHPATTPPTDRPGLRRRYALSGRELTAERLADRQMQLFGGVLALTHVPLAAVMDFI